jgi:hypothetical protein
MEQSTVVTPTRSATRQVWRPKQVVPWVHSKFVADKVIIALRRKKYGRYIVKSSFSANFNHYRFFWHASFAIKQGGHMLTPKIGKTRKAGLTGGPTRLDRPDQSPQKAIWLHRWIGLVEYIKIHI